MHGCVVSACLLFASAEYAGGISRGIGRKKSMACMVRDKAWHVCGDSQTLKQ